MATENLLLEWLSLVRAKLDAAGLEYRIQDHNQWTSCTALDLSSDRFVGTICHWPPDVFEFQFNACDTGKVVILVTKNFRSRTGLAEFVEELLHGLDGAVNEGAG